MKTRFLPFMIGSTYIDLELEAAEEFFKSLPRVCPFCGWGGDVPEHHGYNDDWICPIKWLADNINHLRSGKHIDETIFEAT